MRDEIEKWVMYWKNQPGVELLDFPEEIGRENFLIDYAEVFCKYFAHLDDVDVLFVANGKKGEVQGYIGAGMFSEIAYVISHIARGGKKRVVFAHQPAEKLFCSDELRLWMELGWTTVFDDR